MVSCGKMFALCCVLVSAHGGILDFSRVLLTILTDDPSTSTTDYPTTEETGTTEETMATTDYPTTAVPGTAKEPISIVEEDTTETTTPNSFV